MEEHPKYYRVYLSIYQNERYGWTVIRPCAKFVDMVGACLPI
jgi:hypothetical protein